MITHHLDTERSILHLQPHSSLTKEDFAGLAELVVDPYLAREGDLAGVIVEAPSFPGWDSFGAVAAHLRFVREHHRRIKKIAIVTDSALGNVAEHLVSHFVSAEIRHFPADALEAARQWITRGETPAL